jgi:uncharacterized membrane protein YidH (DUF202 family)
MKLLAVALIVIGIVGLVYGGFSFTTMTHQANLGSIDLSTYKRHVVYIPVGVGIAALVVGIVLLL